MKGLAIVFPRTGYTCQRPLLAACMEEYRAKGYNIVALSFDTVDFTSIDTAENALEAIKPIILAQTAALDLKKYGQTIFISKSLGTLAALWLDDLHKLGAAHLFLTPLPQVVCEFHRLLLVGAVVGAQDPFLTASLLAECCQAYQIPYYIPCDVGHSLWSATNEELNMQIEQQVRALCRHAP